MQIIRRIPSPLFKSSCRLFSTVNRQQNQQSKLLSLLQKALITHKTTHQIHSQLVLTGSLNHSLSMLNALIRCYSFSDTPKNAFFLYKQTHQVLVFNSFTYSFLINAVTNWGDQSAGYQVHGVTIKVGFQWHVYVGTALVNMYVSSGRLSDALLLFDEMPERNVVSWNVMITGFAKWGELEFACSIFDEMPDKNVVSWTGMIDGYVRKGKHTEGLALFEKMVSHEGIKPSEITILAILPAIWHTGNLRLCRLVHGYGEKRGFIASDIRVANSIIDTYWKCGCIVSASRFFEEIAAQRKNLVSWTSIISGLAMHGMGMKAVESFKMMERAGLKPNRVTFLSVLNACSHGGLVDEGLNFFSKMVEYNVAPDIKHYGCLVDMLGRIGRLEEAEKIASGIPSEITNVVIWRTLLGACSFHGNVEIGERVTRKIMEMERGYGGDYVLMHNIFVTAGRFDEAERLRKLMDERNACKLPGHSLV